MGYMGELLDWHYCVNALSVFGYRICKIPRCVFLHTYANKITGIAMDCFPALYWIFGMAMTVFVLCGVASLSAFEELIIIIRSKKLNRNIKAYLPKTVCRIEHKKGQAVFAFRYSVMAIRFFSLRGCLVSPQKNRNK